MAQPIRSAGSAIVGSAILLAAAATACIQVDGLPAHTAGDETAAVEPPRAGTRVASACKSAAEPRDRAWACLTFAGYVEQGIHGLKRDPALAARLQESAVHILEASCDRGDVADCTRAAMVIGTMIGPTDGSSAPESDAAGWMVEYAEQGCRGGDARGCALLGVVYEGGRGVPRDEARSTGYYDQACAARHLPSCRVLASRAEGPARVAAHERACQAGSGHACATAAQHHARGVGVPSSVSRASDLFERGCDLGNPAACVMGAELLEGVKPEERRAVRLAWEACTMSIPDGCLLLAATIERDKGPQRAFEPYQRACELGDARGCAGVRRARGQDRPIDAPREGDGERVIGD